jgi:apolipoprotein N-acyltransferase
MNWGWLAWVSMVPLLCLVRAQAAAGRLYLSAWAGGLVFFLIAIQWMRVADPLMYFTWIALAIYCSFFVPAGIFLVRRLEKRTRLPLVVILPLVWSALEFARAHLLGGFPWYFLAHTQHDFLPAIQIADLAGAYAVTFLVAAANAVVFEWLCAWPRFRTLCALPAESARSTRHGLICQSVALLGLFATTVAYGFWRLEQSEFAVGPRVALIQGNLDQRIRNAAAAEKEEAGAKMVRHYGRLNHEAASTQPKPGLIVWPETSFLYDWIEIAPGLPPEKVPEDLNLRIELFRKFAERTATDLLLGLNCQVITADARRQRYNSALLVRGGDGHIEGRYDKIHCIPFGEYVPFRTWLPWMNAFAPYDYDYSIESGTRLTRFPLGKYHFGVLICYEDTDPYLARQYARTDDGQPPADFLVNISNDGWFNGTEEHEQHLAICRFRAIESRQAVARAVNMGISAVIDGNGRVCALPAPGWSQSKKIAAVLSASIPIDTRTSVYARYGDWMPWTCWLLIGVGLFLPASWGAVAQVRQIPGGRAGVR